MQADNVSARGPQEEENPELVCESPCFQLPCAQYFCVSADLHSGLQEEIPEPDCEPPFPTWSLLPVSP